MTVDQWRIALDDLKRWIGAFHIEFSGGEPYVKKDFLDIARHCSDVGLHWGVTTNGSAFKNRRIAHETVKARPSNINLSIDSCQPAVHGYVRGISDSLADILEGLENLAEERSAQGVHFATVFKPVVHKLNFRELPDLVAWAVRHGASGVNFQPVSRVTPEVDREFWIDGPDLDALQAVVERLIDMKRRGAPIVNSATTLRAWRIHFRDGKAPKEAMPCRIGLRTFFIRATGRVESCWMFPAFGDVTQQSARDIWASPVAREHRRETTKCETLCLFTCLSQKSVLDRVKMAKTVLLGSTKGDDRWRPSEEAPVAPE
jgi:MoaA/NifB/PqqE/SkfB family radical SAM enzyme